MAVLPAKAVVAGLFSAALVLTVWSGASASAALAAKAPFKGSVCSLVSDKQASVVFKSKVTAKMVTSGPAPTCNYSTTAVPVRTGNITLYSASLLAAQQTTAAKFLTISAQALGVATPIPRLGTKADSFSSGTVVVQVGSSVIEVIAIGVPGAAKELARDATRSLKG